MEEKNKFYKTFRVGCIALFAFWLFAFVLVWISMAH